MTVRARALAFSALALLFLGLILAANYVTSEHGMVPVGLGFYATAGTYFAGLTFIVRDSLQDLAQPSARLVQTYRSDMAESWERRERSRWLGSLPVLGLIVAGAGLSYLLADPFIALASGVAFLVAEAADLLVYTPLRDRGYLRAAVASNIIGAALDTVLFLWIAGFPIAGAWQGQMLGKLSMTLLAVLVVIGVRQVMAARRR